LRDIIHFAIELKKRYERCQNKARKREKAEFT